MEQHTKLVVVPGGEQCSVKHVAINGKVVEFAAAGDNVEIAVGGIDELSLRIGQILCWPGRAIRQVTRFKAQIVTFSWLDMPIVPGQQFIFHSHTVEEPCNVTKLLRTLKDGHTDVIKPRCLPGGTVAVVRVRLTRPVSLDTFSDHRRLGRFMLRYGGHTVAAGMILKITL